MVSALNRKLLRDLWNLKGQTLAIAMVIVGGVATYTISFSTLDSLLLGAGGAADRASPLSGGYVPPGAARRSGRSQVLSSG